MEPSDEDLLRKWREGDRRAGNELFQRHYACVRCFFVNKVDRDAELEDLVQRTFTACADARDRFHGRSTFRTYLLGIAHNLLREHYRKRARRSVELDVDDLALVELGAGPPTLIGRAEEERLLLEGLRRIPLGSQVILELYLWEGMSGRELGEFLGVPEDTARTRLRRARLLLDAALQELAASGELLASTTGDLDAWAASVKPCG